VYCYRVASVVGLLSIEIFGYRAPACREYAVHLGKALQLTNILRDVRADAERDRIYLPLEDLHRFGVEPDEVLRHQYSDRFRALANAVADRARSFYRRAREVLPDGDRPAMVAAELMGTIYWRLLEKLARANFNVLGPIRPGVTKAEKLLLVARTWWRFKLGSTAPNYGPP
jgi:phytoene synthase